MLLYTIVLNIGLLVLGAVIIQFLSFLYCHLLLRKKLSSIPGPKTWPIIGSALELRKFSIGEFFRWLIDLCPQYENGMIALWVGPEPSIHIRKPHQIEVILRSQQNVNKSKMYDFLSCWLGNGLGTSRDNIWRQHRRLILPAFNVSIFEQFIDDFHEKLAILHEVIESNIKEDPKKSINMFPLILNFTLDLACKTVMGIDMNTQTGSANVYARSLRRFGELIIARLTSFLYRCDFIFYRTSDGREYQECIKNMHDFSKKVIREKRKVRETKKINYAIEQDATGKRKSKQFLDLLMDVNEADENPLSDLELREEVDTFLFAGYDTLGISISYTLHRLGNEPEIQKKVQEELDEILGDNNRPNKTQLNELKYLGRVIKEALRLYPAVPIIGRKLTDDTVIDGHEIPKNTDVEIHIFQVHRDPEFWENPEKFDPDRFLPENCEGRHPFAYIPFSAGPRNCIGQKFANLILKVTFASILKKWTFVSEHKVHELEPTASLTLLPPNGKINLYMKPRMTT